MSLLNKIGLGECYYCGEEITGHENISKFHIHHLYYTNGNSKNHHEKINVYNEADQHPYRFRVLCEICHRLETLRIHNEEKFLAIYDHIYLRQHRYMFPYDYKTKPVGKSYIFCKNQYDYDKVDDLNNEFSKYYFNNYQEADVEYEKIINHDFSTIIDQNNNPIEEKIQEPIFLLRELFKNKFASYLDTYSNIFKVWSLVEDLMRKPFNIDDYDIKIDLSQRKEYGFIKKDEIKLLPVIYDRKFGTLEYLEND